MTKCASFAEISLILKTIHKHQGESWFEDLWDNRHSSDYMNRCKEDFRMSQRTFEKLVNLLRSCLDKRDTHFRKTIPVKKHVAVAFWRLPNGNSFCFSSRKVNFRRNY